MSFKVRRSSDRGRSDLGWLDSRHTFSFGEYRDRAFESFGMFRVLNEDRVQPGEGFVEHPREDFEIFSYVISGALEHQDSLGNRELIARGDVQFTSAGTGIWHSENNANTDKNDQGGVVHFLQLWVRPSRRGLVPNYQTKKFLDREKMGKLCKIVTPVDSEKDDRLIRINQNFCMFASLLGTGQKVSHNFAAGRRGYLHLAMTNTGASLQLTALPNGNEESITTDRQGGGGQEDDSVVTLQEGDGVFISCPPPAISASASIGMDVAHTILVEGTGTGAGAAEFVLCELD